jgi:Zn-dependent protease
MDPVVRREPKEPEENGQLDEYGFEPVERGYEPIQPASPWRDMLRKFWAPIAFVGFLLWKFKAAFGAIFKFKLFTVVGSAFVSVAAYALIWGWQFGLGFVLLLFVHELGHVAVAKYQGLPVSAPVFIPFMGALILMKEMPQNAWREAQVALGGPILGTLGAAACWGLGETMDSDLLVALAYVGFFLNLFNLIPVLPLDGGRAIGAVHPVFWVLGAAVLVAAAVLWLSPAVLVIVALLGGFELYGRAKDWWRNRGTAGGNRYYAIEPWQRLAVGAVYVGLSALLFLGMAATQVPQDRL